ncbi:hypothetical protein EVAR_57183_1 [Eumeta japonica]|uniref:Mariner Mos1 transposase n=1 Tax=Eumeta variegata TaxID=151549 RepID=A0A4C1YZN3_EUMVA|nr:hypothetical protein EVAR_57183_1 [Eumeta japonica]
MKNHARLFLITGLQNLSTVVSFCDESRDGGPSTAVNNKNARRMIEIDRHVTYHKIRASLDISMSKMQSILHRYLCMKKLCSRWIPRNLTETQKMDCVYWCNSMLKEGALDLVWDIAISDETWIYCYNPNTKPETTV